MTTDAALRFARHIALRQIGPDGQARIGAARVLVAGGDLAAATAARYLEAGGVGTVSAPEVLPPDGAGWLSALSMVDLIVRSGFDDDAMLNAAARLGLPVVVVRATNDSVDLISFPRRAPAPDVSLEIPPRIAAPPARGASAVLAGTLAAAEALTLLARGEARNGGRAGGAARHIRLPLDGSAPLAQQIGAG
jgi:hypothetical protein